SRQLPELEGGEVSGPTAPCSTSPAAACSASRSSVVPDRPQSVTVQRRGAYVGRGQRSGGAAHGHSYSAAALSGIGGGLGANGRVWEISHRLDGCHCCCGSVCPHKGSMVWQTHGLIPDFPSERRISSSARLFAARRPHG
ncbi:hypothetical protein XENOCAPTIV_004713, partial [Xenoophorus captivus]